MIQSTDQLGNHFQWQDFPKRIISIVPSQTEYLFHLGLDIEVIGITRFCIHPRRWKKEKVNIGGTKTLNLPLIRSLNPDVIIGNKEENERAQIEELSGEFPVWMSDVPDLERATGMMSEIGSLTGRIEAATDITTKINAGFRELQKQISPSPKRVLYLIWYKPWMAAGPATFIGDMIAKCGFQNVISAGGRYPELSPKEIMLLQPDVVFLSSEPFHFSGKHERELREKLPTARIIPVDGEYFSWYGSRLLDAPEYFLSLCLPIQTAS